MTHILLTGATGLLGQYLLRDLQLAGARLAVLIRAQDKQPASRRLGKVLEHWNQQLKQPLPRPMCLEGDIACDGLGLTREARDWVARHCHTVLHNAASLLFVRSDRADEPWRSNLTGCENLLRFCRQTGIRRFQHVSTAYVCGQRRGTVYEHELDCGQGFRNDYEHSKCEAEKRLHAADFLESLTIYRPALIVGDSQTGYTSTYHGLYSYLRAVPLVTQFEKPQADGRYYIPVRLKWTGGEPRNMVPVDWVSATITHLALARQWHGRTYHLTPDVPLSVADCEQFIAEYFNYHGPYFAGPDAFKTGAMTEHEKAFYEHVSTYEAYWECEVNFDNRNTREAAPHLPCPVIDKACLHRLIDFAMNDNWGKPQQK